MSHNYREDHHASSSDSLNAEEIALIDQVESVLDASFKHDSVAREEEEAKDGVDDSNSVNSDQKWYKSLSQEEREVVDEGIEAILSKGLRIAADRTFNTLLIQKEKNLNDGMEKPRKSEDSTKQEVKENGEMPMDHNKNSGRNGKRNGRRRNRRRNRRKKRSDDRHRDPSSERYGLNNRHRDNLRDLSSSQSNSYYGPSSVYRGYSPPRDKFPVYGGFDGRSNSLRQRSRSHDHTRPLSPSRYGYFDRPPHRSDNFDVRRPTDGCPPMERDRFLLGRRYDDRDISPSYSDRHNSDYSHGHYGPTKNNGRYRDRSQSSDYYDNYSRHSRSASLDRGKHRGRDRRKRSKSRERSKRHHKGRRSRSRSRSESTRKRRSREYLRENGYGDNVKKGIDAINNDVNTDNSRCSPSRSRSSERSRSRDKDSYSKSSRKRSSRRKRRDGTSERSGRGRNKKKSKKSKKE